MGIRYETLRAYSASKARAEIRRGTYSSHTAGLADGHVQANLVILPERFAPDFRRYCQRNPKPCPLLAETDTGDPYFRTLGHDLDVRSDIPSYNLYRDGQLINKVRNIADLWRDDLVAFALGCSFTFDNALAASGIDVWHVANNTTVPMFRSDIETVPAAPFHGRMVVSMRALPEVNLEKAIEISRHFPLAHGAPVHVGAPEDIGIQDVARPDWGDPAPVPPQHVPVFWACGVTPQEAMRNAMLPFVITHTPGHMLITDVSPDTGALTLPDKLTPRPRSVR